MLKMNWEYLKGVLFIDLNGMFSKDYLNEWYKDLLPFIKKHNIKELVLIINNLYYIDDIGITTIRDLKDYMNNNYGKLYLYGDNYIILKHLKHLI